MGGAGTVEVLVSSCVVSKPGASYSISAASAFASGDWLKRVSRLTLVWSSDALATSVESGCWLSGKSRARCFFFIGDWGWVCATSCGGGDLPCVAVMDRFPAEES